MTIRCRRTAALPPPPVGGGGAPATPGRPTASARITHAHTPQYYKQIQRLLYFPVNLLLCGDKLLCPPLSLSGLRDLGRDWLCAYVKAAP